MYIWIKMDNAMLTFTRGRQNAQTVRGPGYR